MLRVGGGMLFFHGLGSETRLAHQPSHARFADGISLLA